MKKIVIALLQAVVVLVGITTFIFILWEPHLEGRNVGATIYEIYFKDPFLAYVYASSSMFFIALYQVFGLLRHASKNTMGSPNALRALQITGRSTTALIVLIAGAIAYIVIIVRRTEDDIAGGVAIGLFMLFFLAMVTVLAFAFERYLRRTGEASARN